MVKTRTERQIENLGHDKQIEMIFNLIMRLLIIRR